MQLVTLAVMNELQYNEVHTAHTTAADIKLIMKSVKQYHQLISTMPVERKNK